MRETRGSPGDGFATLSLANTGVVSIIGQFADGTPLTASAERTTLQ